MKRLDGRCIARWAKRLGVYLLGLYLMAIGVVFSARSSLGVSPVGSPANVLFQIARAAGAPAWVDLGNCTTATYCLYILAEALLLRRECRPAMLLQLPASLLFGQLVNLATAMLAGLPAPESYPLRLLYLLCSVPLVACGVMLYLSPNLVPTPGEGMSLAVSKRTGLSVGAAKTVFDCALVLLSAAASLLYFRRFVGVREGTVVCALLVGFVLRQLQKRFEKPLLRFTEREDKLSRALRAAGAEALPDSGERPKLLVAVGREFGAGGAEVARRLAEMLGVPFYDRRLDELAARRGGIPMERVEALERRLRRSVVSDLLDAPYAMSNEALTEEERLHVAQESVIRSLAADGESCVILGRCADWVLRDEPDCFRVFIHARPDVRVRRTMALFGLDEAEARRQMENTDRARARHYRRFTGREYGRQEYYHLGVDSGVLGVEESAAVIFDALRRWCAVRGTHPLTTLTPRETPGEETQP